MSKKIGILVVSLVVLFGIGYFMSKATNGIKSPETANAIDAVQELQTTNTSRMLQTVDPDTFAIKNTEQNRIIIDVRTPEEFASGHIEGAINTNFYDPAFKETISKLDTSSAYSIYCRSGNRSGQTLGLMESLGFTDVLDLEGGIGSWIASGRSL